MSVGTTTPQHPVSNAKRARSSERATARTSTFMAPANASLNALISFTGAPGAKENMPPCVARSPVPRHAPLHPLDHLHHAVLKPGTPISPDWLYTILQGHPDAQFLQQGFKGGFYIPHLDMAIPLSTRNHSSAKLHSKFLRDYIAKEL